MKKQNMLVGFLVIMVLIFSACGGNNKIEPNASGNKNPGLSSFVSTDISGTNVDQTVFADHKLTMVNIWATFCSPCIEEMPELALLNADYAKDDFQVVGIVADVMQGDEAGLETALSIVTLTGANYLHILSSESLLLAKLNSVQYVPETIFVDSLGNQVGESYVGSKSYDDWSKIIESLVTEIE